MSLKSLYGSSHHLSLIFYCNCDLSLKLKALCFPIYPSNFCLLKTHGIGILKEPTHPFTLRKTTANHPCFLTSVPQDCLSLAVTIIHATPPLGGDQESDYLSLLMSKLSCKLRKIELHKERQPRVLQTVLLRKIGMDCILFAHHLVKDKNILCEDDSLKAVAAVAILPPHHCLESLCFYSRGISRGQALSGKCLVNYNCNADGCWSF